MHSNTCGRGFRGEVGASAVAGRNVSPPRPVLSHPMTARSPERGAWFLFLSLPTHRMVKKLRYFPLSIDNESFSMVKPQIGGRVPQPLKDRFDEYAEEKSLTQTDAMRELIQTGLDYEAGELPDTEESAKEHDRPETLTGWAFLALGFTSAAAATAAEWMNSPEALLTFVIIGAAWGIGGIAGVAWVGAAAAVWYALSIPARVAVTALSTEPPGEPEVPADA